MWRCGRGGRRKRRRSTATGRTPLASLVIFAVPAQEMRRNVRLVREHIAADAPLLSVAKGLEKDSTKRMTQVIAEEMGPSANHRLCAISGPNFSKEVAEGLPAATVIAARDGAVVGAVQQIMDSPTFKVERTVPPRWAMP